MVKEELHEGPGYVPVKIETDTKVVPKYEINMTIAPTHSTDTLSIPGHQWFIENSIHKVFEGHKNIHDMGIARAYGYFGPILFM